MYKLPVAIVWQSCGNRVAVARQTCGSRDCCGRGNGHGADHHHDMARAMAMGNTVFESKILDKTGRLMQPSQHGMKIYTHVRVAFLLFHSRNCATLVPQVKEPTNGCFPNQFRRAARVSPCPEAAPRGEGRHSTSVWSSLYRFSSTLTLLSLSLSLFQIISLSLNRRDQTRDQKPLRAKSAAHTQEMSK